MADRPYVFRTRQVVRRRSIVYAFDVLAGAPCPYHGDDCKIVEINLGGGWGSMDSHPGVDAAIRGDQPKRATCIYDCGTIISWSASPPLDQPEKEKAPMTGKPRFVVDINYDVNDFAAREAILAIHPQPIHHLHGSHRNSMRYGIPHATAEEAIASAEFWEQSDLAIFCEISVDSWRVTDRVSDVIGIWTARRKDGR